jgi:hypothetical protein
VFRKAATPVLVQIMGLAMHNAYGISEHPSSDQFERECLLLASKRHLSILLLDWVCKNLGTGNTTVNNLLTLR